MRSFTPQAIPKDRADTPLFEAVGYHEPRVGICVYAFRIGDRVRWFRAWELQGLPFLLELHSDVDHWRSAFPGLKRGGIDMLKAAAHFMTACKAMGMLPYPEASKSLGVTDAREGGRK